METLSKFLVVLNVSGFHFRSKFGRHSFSVNSFICKVFFPERLSCIFVFTIATIFARDSRQQYPFMHESNSTLNTLSSIANQTADLPKAMRFKGELARRTETIEKLEFDEPIITMNLWQNELHPGSYIAWQESEETYLTCATRCHKFLATNKRHHSHSCPLRLSGM